ncbi:MAG: nitrate/nitrite transporter NrtS [Deltaproteobacteria bacterium]|nr:nitrate/nitrite transporter NrtS [Deltaproteobacteria bacterium]
MKEPDGIDRPSPGRRSRWRTVLRNWFLPATVKHAIGVAAVVGPVLTVINQPEAVFALEFSPRVLLKIALTFLVPYSVSSYSSAHALTQAEARDDPPPARSSETR